MLRPSLWILLAGLLALSVAFACQTPAEPPEDTVKVFLKALERDDYPGMAKLVIGGKPEYKFSKLRSKDHYYHQAVSRVEFTILDSKMDGDTATVTIKWRFSTKGDQDRGGGNNKEVVPLKLIDGQWLIVPYTKQSPSGYFIEELADVLSNPENEFVRLESAFSGTRNISATESQLGKERAEFMSAALNAEGPNEEYVPYSGYKSMTMVEHTLVFWPVGRADEVIFNMGLEQADYFTCWRKVNGKPKRLWQVKVGKLGKRKAPYDGTLAKWLAKAGDWPVKTNAEMIQMLKVKQPYAAYIEVGAIGSFMCWVMHPDGSSDPKKSKYGLDNTMQDSYQAFNQGFFVTPEESMIMAAAKPR